MERQPKQWGAGEEEEEEEAFSFVLFLAVFSGPRPRMNESLLSSGSSSSTHIWAGGGKRQHRVFQGKKLKKNHLHISRKNHFA